MLSRFAVAFQFLTVLPLFEARPANREDLAGAMGAFPLGGVSLGAGLAAVHATVGHRLPGVLEGAVLVVLLAWATGGFHLDGVADTADGLSGGWTPARALEIMRDSRVGAMGAVAVASVLLVKSLAVGTSPPGELWRVLVVFPAVGRAAAVAVAHGSRYARPEGGLGEAYAGVDRRVALEALWWVAGASLLLGWRGLAALGAVWAYTAWLRGKFRRRLDGVTGDGLGFAVETAECVFLLALHMLQ